MSSNFKLYSKYYDLLYNDKDYHSEIEYISKLLTAYSSRVQNILEFGSGTGKHGLLLKNKGYRVYGLERSEEMVATAQKDGLSCEVADISKFSLKTKFDAVIAMFHVVSYLTSNESLIAAFENACKHLSQNGVFIFDVWYSPAVYTLKAIPRIKRFENEEISITRIAEPKIDNNQNMVNVNYSIIAKEIPQDNYNMFKECHPMRHFSIPEIDLLAKHTGFEILQAEEFLTGSEPSENTWGVCFILKKR